MTLRRSLSVVALPLLLLAGCKPEELAALDPNASARGSADSDANTSLRALNELVLNDASTSDLQLSEKVSPKTGHCSGQDVFIFSGADKMLWIDLPELRRNNGGGPMVRADFQLFGNTLRMMNAQVVDVFGVPQSSLRDSSFNVQKGSAGGVRIDSRLVFPCQFTISDFVR